MAEQESVLLGMITALREALRVSGIAHGTVVTRISDIQARGIEWRRVPRSIRQSLEAEKTFSRMSAAAVDTALTERRDG